MRFLVGLALLTLVLQTASAAAPARSLVTKPTVASAQKEANAWGVSFSYSGMTDLLDEMEKTYSHSLGISPSYRMGAWGFAAFTSYEYQSIGREVVKEDDPTDRPGLGDSGFAASHVYKLTEKLALQNSISEVLPTSQVSKDEGYRSILSIKSALPIPLYGSQWTLNNSLGFSYIFNTFETSQTMGTANPQWSTSYGLSTVVKMTKYWTAGAGLDVRSTHFLDGVNRFRPGNMVFLGFNLKNWSSRLSYSNSPDRVTSANTALDSLEALQIDHYRQVISWELSCGF